MPVEIPNNFSFGSICAEALARVPSERGRYLVSRELITNTDYVEQIYDLDHLKAPLDPDKIDYAFIHYLESWKTLLEGNQVWRLKKLGDECQLLVECSTGIPQHDYLLCNEGLTIEGLELRLGGTAFSLFAIGAFYVLAIGTFTAQNAIFPVLPTIPTLGYSFLIAGSIALGATSYLLLKYW